MRRFKRAAIYSGVICLMVVFLIVAYGFLGNSNPQVSPQKPLPTARPVNCGVADISFCQTEGVIRGEVEANDFSDVLENQTPTSAICGSKSPLESYCQSEDKGLVIQLFQVQQSNGLGFMTRNQYITFFASYASQYGPFKYVDASTNGNTAYMHFTDQPRAYEYNLLFSKQGSQWKVVYPTIGSVTAS